jgi:C4-dicarboxylate-specific signal transduction histidine kinase
MAAAFLAAATMQLRDGRGQHRHASWWLAAASLAAAAATLLAPMRDLGWLAPATASEAGVWLLVGWLGTLAWFVVAHTDGDGLRRGAALAVSLLLALILVERLPWPIGNAATLGNRHAIPLVAATVIVALLLADAAWRCWIARQRLSAVAFLGGMGAALLAIALARTTDAAVSLPVASLVAFLVAIALLANDGASPGRGGRDTGGPLPRLVVVGELGAAIAHEINQPLGAILSNAEACDLLLQDGASPAELRVIMADIRRDAVRASNVIRQVRSLARRPELALDRMDANELVAGVIVLMTPDSRGRRIPIEGMASPTPAWVRVDRTQMQQVLINLVTNAMDAIESLPGVDGSSGMPPVVVSVAAHEDEVIISVIDAGPGLPTEALDHLFATFYTTKAHGMGLGLSIARSIVESHGGRVQAENNPIAGARFSVVLPADVR